MHALKLALVSPKGPLYRHRGGVFPRSLRYAPLTLPTLAALVPGHIPHTIALYDEGIQDIPPGLDADLVGITVITGTAPRSYELAHRLRARGIAVVLGGPHVTLVPEDAAPHADAIVVGYAEDTWPQLLDDFAAGRLAPRYDQAPGLSLAGRPRARRDLIPRGRYLTTHVFEATRGCVHSCEFCVVPSAWGRQPYQRPVDEVVEEVRSTGARSAIFIDLNIVADRDHAARLFAALVPLRLAWYGLATTLLADDVELLALAARSGCRGLLVGFESLAPHSLRSVHKGFSDPARYRQQIDAFHRHGIAIQGTFVFGLDHDTRESLARTAEFAIEARIELPRFAVLTPFPGTPVHTRLAAEGRLLTRDWQLYDGQHVVYQPAHMSIAELEDATRAAWRRAYALGSIARRLRGTPAPLSVVIGANLGYRYYARNLSRFYTCDQPLARSGDQPLARSGDQPLGRSRWPWAGAGTPPARKAAEP